MPRKQLTAGRIRPARSATRPDNQPPSLCPRAADCLVAQAVAGLAIGLILIDSRGRVVWLNRAAERILGMTEAQCVGRSLASLLRDPQLAAFWNEAGCQSGNCMASVSVRWPTPLELKLNATHCLDQDGGEIGRALLFCDVTTDRMLTMELTREVADRLLQLSGDGQPPAALAGLTSQERRVLQQVGRGLGNEEIAGAMNVATSTVRSHLKSIYRKLGLHTRAQAVHFAVRNHLT